MAASKTVDITQKRWFQRGFTDEKHYQGWLHFNDLIDTSHTHDDVYRDDFSGRVIHLMGDTDSVSLDSDDEAAQFLNKKDK